MRISFTSLLIALLLGSVYQSEAQQCGTILTEAPDINYEAFLQYQRSKRFQRNLDSTRYIGITVHVVEEVAGAANIEVELLYDELEAVNRYFSTSGLQFFFCGAPRFVQGTRSVYTYDQAAAELNTRYHVPNTINIFYLDEIGDPQFTIAACGISTFPFSSTPATRFIIMQKACSVNGSTLAHEIGHFFGLLHTHETAVGVELVDRSNCERAGDRLCDTPADPNLLATGLQGCTYVAPFTDPNGDTYRPDPRNLMSYAPSNCRRRFSSDQNDLMNFWYDTELNYLLSDCDFYPDFVLEGSSNALAVSSGQQIDFPLEVSQIGLEQEAEVEIQVSIRDESDGLTFVLLRDTLTVGINEDVQIVQPAFELPTFFSSGTYTLSYSLDPRSSYLERDKRNNFVNVVLTVDNSSYADALLFPNPAENQTTIFIRDAGLSGDVSIQVADLLGRVFIEEDGFKGDDEFFAELDISGLRHGAYMVSVLFDKSGRRFNFMFLKP